MKIFFLLATVTSLVLPEAKTQAAGSDTNTSSTAAPANPVLARGNGFEISRREVDQVLATARAQHPEAELPPDAAIHALTHLIEIRLVFNQATVAEQSEGETNADRRIANILNTLGPVEMEHRLQATHMTAADLHRMLGQETTAQASLTRQLGIQVTDAAAREYFDSHPGAYDRPPVARVRELLLLTTSDFSTSAAPPLPATVIQAKRKLMDGLLQRLRAGENFTALARQYNEDPVSKDSAGEISFTQDQMEFGGLAFSMKPGQTSDLLTNVDGFRIFQLLEIVPAQKAGYADVSNQIKSGLIGEAKRRLAPAYIKRLTREANVQILDPGMKAAIAANEAEMAANAKKAAAAQASAAVEANSPAQKEAEARVFGKSTNPPPPGP